MRRLAPLDEERDQGVLRHGQPPADQAGLGLTGHVDGVPRVVAAFAGSRHHEVELLGTDGPAGQSRPREGGDPEPARRRILSFVRADQLEVTTVTETVQQVSGAHPGVAPARRRCEAKAVGEVGRCGVQVKNGVDHMVEDGHQKIIGRSSSTSTLRSTTTGTWSLGASPLRSLRWMLAPVTSSANADDPRMKSMRMPSLRGKASCL